MVKTLMQESSEKNEDVLLTRTEVAKLLSISLVTLHNHNIKGILKPSHKIGRKPLYLKSNVLKQIQMSNNNLFL